jgi:hypothetical protein
MAPEPGLLWTPGYWGWGAQVGFYGGINYGFGYAGVGYQGGYWNNGGFFYNRSVNNVTNVTNVYTKTVIVNNVTSNVSYNGGTGGLSARPTAAEQTAANQKHVARTSVQVQHVQTASTNHQLYESVNHGKPAIAATAKPGQFSGGGVVAAKAAAPSYKPVTARAAAPAAPKAAAAHANEQKPAARPAPQQAKLNTSQAQDHQQLTKTKASEPAAKQQTQQVAQKQKLQVKPPPASPKPEAKPAPKPAPKAADEKKEPN